MDFDTAFQRWVMGSSRSLAEVQGIILPTNIDQVDHEHRRLVQYALAMNGAISDLQQRGLSHRLIASAQDSLDELYAYADHHFSSEERLMGDNRIPGLAMMHELHQSLLASMRGYQADFRAGRSFASLDLKIVILDWVIGHINHVDHDAFAIAKLEEILTAARQWPDVAPFIKRTQIQMIDADHHAIAELLLELNRLDLDAPPATADGIIRRLDETAAAHFSREEHLLGSREIGLTDEHRGLHRRFLERLAGLRGRPVAEQLAIRGELVAWLVDHVNGQDMRCFAHGSWLRRIMRECSGWQDVAEFMVRIGIEAIDHDHEEFIRRVFGIDHLIGGDEADRDKAAAAATALTELRRFAAAHFGREEDLMAAMHHPIIPRHRHEHRDLLDKLDGFVANLADGSVALGPAIRERLFAWWIEHTNSTDLETFSPWKP